MNSEAISLLPRDDLGHESAAAGEGRRPVAATLDIAEAYRTHYGFVWRMMSHLGVPAEATDDAVHDVFVVVSRRSAEYRQDTSVRAWLTAIARLVARDHRKLSFRRWRRRLMLRFAWASNTSDGEIGRAEAARIVRQLLEALPEDQRLALVLSEIEGLTAPEIADALGTKLNTVYSRIRSARRRLESVAAASGKVQTGGRR